MSTTNKTMTTYHKLLNDPTAAKAMERRAHERVLDEHTYAHRARQILDLVGAATPVPAHG